MICDMKRAAGFVSLLGLAFSAATRPALAQDGASNSWFDGTSPASSAPAAPPADGPPGDAPPPPSDATPPSDARPPAPARGPHGESLNEPPSAPPPQAPQQGPQDNAPETDPRAVTEFRPTLDPYGTWVDDEKYGTVWVPNRDAVGEDFAPYVSAGHWALTDDGDWIWQSDYPFGDVVFHYGRWVWLPGTGWAWVAGQRYANAWVTWRVPTDDYGYVGWAPMPPTWGWYGGSAVSLGWYPPAAYVFCPSSYAFSYNVHSYIVHDRYVIHDVAAHTRNYSAGGGLQHVAASPRAFPANSVPPRGPSLQSAHVPVSMALSSRVASAAFGGAGSSTAQLRSAQGYARPGGASPTGYRSAYSSPSNGQRPAYSSPSASSYRSVPQHSWPANSAPRSYSPSTSRGEPAERYSAPAYQAVPAPPAYHYSAPAVHYSAPAVHYSAPAYHSSAPAFHSAPSHSFHSSSRR
jgi:hypothetical protein